MICDAETLLDSAAPLVVIPPGAREGVSLYLICAIAARDEAVKPPPPCAVTITIEYPGPTLDLQWTNPVAYDSIEIWHKLPDSYGELVATQAGNTTSYTVSPIEPMEFFAVRGKKNGFFSVFGNTSPCP